MSTVETVFYGKLKKIIDAAIAFKKDGLASSAGIDPGKDRETVGYIAACREMLAEAERIDIQIKGG